MLIRVLDIIIALVGLLCLGLMLPWVALLIKMESRGPVFYGCDRVGKGGRLFKMFKFRTMHETESPLGHSVSPQGDPRVTEMGRWLRRTKLNEFPQFYNLLKGDMTFIGPRPEAPDLAAAYPPEAQEIFAVKPGVLGPNQISGRNEEEMYPAGVNPRLYYLESILPPKVARDLDYLRHKTFLGDLKLIILGMWAMVSGAISRRHLTDNLTQLLMVGIDVACCLASLSLASWLRYSGLIPQAELDILLQLLPLAVLCRLPIFYYFGFYQTLIRYFSLADVKNIFDGVLLASGLFVVVSFLSGIDLRSYGRTICIIDWFLLTCMLIGYRGLARAVHMRLYGPHLTDDSSRRRALIWRADDEGIWCYRFLREQSEPVYEVVGFLDPDPHKRHRRIDGLKVLGDQHHLEVLSALYRVQEVFITNGASQPSKVAHLQQICAQLSLGVKRFVPRSVEEVQAAGDPLPREAEECGR
jgi:lipopolysaccharide/colanic/teichoic acid biosynthesis glycosyltransferase